MKCTTEGCTGNAVAALQFPWPSEPVDACADHVTAAQQLMQNLGRENELRISPLEQDAPATPRDPAERQVVETHAVDDGRAKVLVLELELERERTKRAELVIAGLDQVLDKAAKLWEQAKTEAPELVSQFVAQFIAATAAGTEELERVEGEPPAASPASSVAAEQAPEGPQP